MPTIGGVAAADWEVDTTTASIVECCSKVGPGDIVLLHTWATNAIDALPDIVRNLRAKGIRFVTVSEMMALAAPSTS